MNEALKLTGQSTPSGNIPFLLHRSKDESRPQPLLIFLHGSGEGSPNGTMTNTGVHDETTVRVLENGSPGNTVGPFTLTKTSDLPVFTDPIRGTTHSFYMMGPQLYYKTNGQNGQTETTNRGLGYPWPLNYTTALINYALSNLNIDRSRIYLTGLSLGGGGTWNMCMEPSVYKYIAAACPICPGYANNGSWDNNIRLNLTRSGIPILAYHAQPDTATNGSGGELVSDQIIRKHNAGKPVRSVNYIKFNTGGHFIWNRIYTLNRGDSYTTSNGVGYTHNELLWEWFLRYRKPDAQMPTYIF